MSEELPGRIVADIAFVGRGGGHVKALAGFRKGHHTLPDAANDATNAFLGKICGAELNEEAEKTFQAVRTGLAYKRKDVSLSLTSPTAVLTARDFVVEWCYAVDSAEPARYTVTTILRALTKPELARTPEFSAIFARRFSEISFELTKGAEVDAVIDAIENLDGKGGLEVSYPSDYRHCEIRVEGVDAHVRCTPAALELVFLRPGAPAELIEAFADVRAAFGISPELEGLIA